MKKGIFGVLFAGLFCIGPLFAQYKSTIKNETVLYNNIDQLLPLTGLDQRRIAVIVPNAENMPRLQASWRVMQLQRFLILVNLMKISNIIIPLL